MGRKKNVILAAVILFVTILWTCDIATAGQLIAWGYNYHGQCDVPAGDDFIAISTSGSNGYALKSDGSIVGWGYNFYLDIPEGNDFVAIAAGYSHGLALKSDGSLVGWGSNYYGQCDVPEGNDFVAIEVGMRHSLALKSDGSLVAWGDNEDGQCDVPAGNDFIKIAAGPYHNLAIRSDSSLSAWGDNTDGTCNVPEGNDFVDIGADWFHSEALRSDGSLSAWGYRGSLITLPTDNDFVAIAIGSSHSLAIKSDGSLAAWGCSVNSYGQCDIPEHNDFIGISVRDYYSLGLVSEPNALVGIEIVGPDDVRENDQIQYKIVAHYNDGSTRNATDFATWGLDSNSVVSIETGLMLTNEISQSQDIIIYVSYTEGDVTIDTEMTVQITFALTRYVPSEYGSIQSAIDAAWDGDTIIVADGTYTGSGNRDIEFRGKVITVKSENGPENCIIDCQGLGRGFYFYETESPNSILDGLTITNGYNEDRGGAIACRISNPTIMNCIIIANHSGGTGGGINSGYMSNPTIINCKISGNSANFGGGISCLHDITPWYPWNTIPKIVNCTITENYAEEQGGGIFSGYATSSIISNCLITGNSSGISGGGIYCADTAPEITNCSFTENTSPLGNFLACNSYDPEYPRPSEIELKNCIIWDGANSISNDDGSIINISYSDVQGGWFGQGNINTDPGFADAANGDYHLLPDSPCIDAGDPNHTTETNETDIRGHKNCKPGNFLKVMCFQ